MGCDIHAFVEKKNENGVWEAVYGESCTLNWYKVQLAIAITNNDRNNIEFYTKHIDQNAALSLDWLYDGRCYDLFALLADVRNYNHITPISDPKGFPDDVSKEIKEKADEWEYDGHSYSYYTLSELNKYIEMGKDNYYTNGGYIGRSEYVTFLKKGRPSSWSRNVAGANVAIVSNEKMEKILADTYENYNPDKSYYTYVEWKDNVISDTGLDYIVAKLATVCDDNDENVRMVFWFDN